MLHTIKCWNFPEGEVTEGLSPSVCGKQHYTVFALLFVYPDKV